MKKEADRAETEQAEANRQLSEEEKKLQERLNELMSKLDAAKKEAEKNPSQGSQGGSGESGPQGPLQIPGVDPKKLSAPLENLQKAGEKMKQAQEQMSQNQNSQPSQEDAIKALQKTIDDLEGIMKESVSKEDSRAFDELRERQHELQQKLEELMESNEEVKKNDKAKTPMGGAKKKMEAAENKLDQKRSGPAQEDQQEAQEQLDQAKKALEEKLNEYVDMQKEKLLLHIASELTRLVEKETQALNATRDVDLQIRAKGRLTSSLRREVDKVGETQAEVKKISDKIIEALKTGSYPGFAMQMNWVDENLAEIKRLLDDREPDTGANTQDLQQEVIDMCGRLAEAVKREAERIPKKKSGGGGGSGDPPPPRPSPIVNKLAEMELMRLEQMEINRKIEQIKKANPNAKRDEMPEAQRRIFERLSHRQGELKTTMDNLRKELEASVGGGGR